MDGKMGAEAEKEAMYAPVREQLAAVLDACPDAVAAMASVAALLKAAFDHVSWVGFYLPESDGSLRVGPFQGPLACLRLPPGRGVCGAAARQRKTILVPDVAAFPGHIACDPHARSEIVVPVLKEGELVAVLDVDSARPAAFDGIDRNHLEAIASLLSAALPTP